MRLFAYHYPQNEFSQALPDQLTWTHHIVLIQMIEEKELSAKQWYAEHVIEQGWSYRQLRNQIQSRLYEGQGDKSLKTTNFHDKLPATLTL